MKFEDEPPKNLIFIHSAIDEAGLDVYEFRLLCHIARRGRCFASLSTTAEICQMSIRKAQSTIKSLLEKKLIEEHRRDGRTNVYWLAPNLWDKVKPTSLRPEVNYEDLGVDELIDDYELF